MPDRGDDGAVGGAGRAAARPQIERPDTAAAPRYGVAAPVGGSVKMTLGVSAVLSLRHFGLVFIPCRVSAAPTGNRATRSRRLLAAVADSVLANAGSGRRWRGRRRRARSRQAADRAAGHRGGAEIRGRRASRGLCKNDIRGSPPCFLSDISGWSLSLCRGAAAPTGNRATR